jgi:hypothetical protein
MTMLRFLLLLSILSTTSSVHVLVADAASNPMQGVRVELVLYDFKLISGRTQVQKTFSDHCITDLNGECTIEIGVTRGSLRGRLSLGKYGGRDVIWPGGELNAPIMVDLKNNRVKGTEAGAYDFQEKDGGVTIGNRTPWLLIFLATVLVSMIVFGAYIRSRKEHA